VERDIGRGRELPPSRRLTFRNAGWPRCWQRAIRSVVKVFPSEPPDRATEGALVDGATLVASARWRNISRTALGAMSYAT